MRKPSFERKELVKARRSTSGDEAGGALCGLQRDVAGKSFGDDHVRFARAELVALDEPVEAQRQAGRIAQHGGGVADDVRALELLGADVEQPHARHLHVEDRARIGRAHDRELDEIAGIALGIGAQVEHHGIVGAERRHKSGQRGPVDAGERAQGELRHRHERTGIAGRHGGTCRPVLHSLDGEAHGAATGLPDGLAGLVRRGDDAVGVDDLRHRREIGMALQRLANLRLVAIERVTQMRMTTARERDARDGDAHAFIAAHRIDRDPRRVHSERPLAGSQAPMATISRPL